MYFLVSVFLGKCNKEQKHKAMLRSAKERISTIILFCKHAQDKNGQYNMLSMTFKRKFHRSEKTVKDVGL